MFIRRESFNDFVRLYPVSFCLLCLNGFLFLIVQLPFPDNPIMGSTIGFNLLIQEGEYWRLLTPVFLHTSPTHFIFNSFALLLFAPAVEMRLRPSRFLLLYLLCGIGANAATYFIMPLSYAHMGASGAIFGCLGFLLYLVFFNKHTISRQDANMIQVMSLFALLGSFLHPNVNLTAHLSGFIIGFLLAFVLYDD